VFTNAPEQSPPNKGFRPFAVRSTVSMSVFGWDVQVGEITEEGGITLEPRRRPRDASVEGHDD